MPSLPVSAGPACYFIVQIYHAAGPASTVFRFDFMRWGRKNRKQAADAASEGAFILYFPPVAAKIYVYDQDNGSGSKLALEAETWLTFW